MEQIVEAIHQVDFTLNILVFQNIIICGILGCIFSCLFGSRK